VDVEVLEEIGAGSEGESARLGDLALTGDMRALAADLAQEPAIESISLLRAMQRRLSMLAPLRARVDSGARAYDVVTSAGKAVFFKEKTIVAAMLDAWDSPRLARLAERIGELERRLMRPDSPPDAQALVEELVAIARGARRQ
jgi:DNA polymerase-3 subunit delta